MFLLSPAKLLVVLVVAVVVLGPDRLPRVARQIGGLWRTAQGLRQRLESEGQGAFPDLPSTDTIARAVRSPLTLLDSLSDEHAGPVATGAEGPGPPDDAATPGAGGGDAPADWLRSLQSLGVDGSELD